MSLNVSRGNTFVDTARLENLCHFHVGAPDVTTRDKTKRGMIAAEKPLDKNESAKSGAK